MQSQTRPGTLAALAAAGVVLGAIATSSNPVFVRLSDVPETASAFHRMAWALPAFALWGFAAGLGTRRTGAGKGRGRRSLRSGPARDGSFVQLESRPNIVTCCCSSCAASSSQATLPRCTRR